MLPEEAMEAALEGVGLAEEAEQPVGEAQTEAEVAADGTWLGEIGQKLHRGGARRSARGTAVWRRPFLDPPWRSKFRCVFGGAVVGAA